MLRFAKGFDRICVWSGWNVAQSVSGTDHVRRSFAQRNHPLDEGVVIPFFVKQRCNRGSARPEFTSNRALRRRNALELLGRRSRSADNDVTPSNVGLPNARAYSCSIDQNFGITTYEHTPFFGLPLAHDENRTYGITSPRLISRFVLSWLNGACGTTHARHNRTIPRFNQSFLKVPSQLLKATLYWILKNSIVPICDLV